MFTQCNVFFSNLLLTIYEAVFGKIVVKADVAVETLSNGKVIKIQRYEVKEKESNKGIQQKFSDAELILTYLNPQLGPSLTLEPIINMNDSAIIRLKTMERSSKTKSKIQLIETLTSIIHEFVTDKQTKAQNLFAEYVNQVTNSRILRQEFRYK